MIAPSMSSQDQFNMIMDALRALVANDVNGIIMEDKKSKDEHVVNGIDTIDIKKEGTITTTAAAAAAATTDSSGDGTTMDNDHDNVKASSTLLHSRLEANLSVVNDIVESLSLSTPCCSNDNNILWRFVSMGMALLSNMADVLKDIRDTSTDSTAAILSNNDQRVVQTVLETIACWGVSTHLLPGVGIPVQKRVSVAVFESLHNEDINVGPSFTSLLKVTVTLLHFARDTTLSPLVIRNHIVDIVAGSVQLVHCAASISCRDSVSDYDNRVINSPAAIGPSSSKPLRDARKVLVDAEMLLKDVHPLVAISGLLSLLRSPPRPPSWVSSSCGRMLSGCILRPGGVRAFLTTVVESEGYDDSTSFQRRCDHAVRILSTVPSKLTSTECYITSIAPQVLALVRTHRQNSGNGRGANSSSSMGRLIRISHTVVSHLLDKFPALTRRHLLGPVLMPLISAEDTKNTKCGVVLIDEQQLARCVEDLHAIFVIAEPSERLLETLVPVIPILFRLYCFTARSRANLRTAAEEILVTFFKLSSNETAVNTLIQLVLPPAENDESDNDDAIATFVPGGSGGVAVRTVPRLSKDRDLLWEAEKCVDLLASLRRDGLAGDFFVCLLRQIMRSKKARKEQDNLQRRSTQANSGNEFLEAPSNMAHDETHILGIAAVAEVRFILLLQIVAMMTERLGTAILTDTAQVISFIEMLLQSPDSETVVMSLGLLASLLSGGVAIASKAEGMLEALLPVLEPFSQHEDEQIREMACDLRVSIVTRNWNCEDKSENDGGADFNETMADLAHPLLPVRAHGLLSLRRHVLERHPRTTGSHTAKVLSIFEAQVRHEDSYIYLSAIQGLAALGDVYPSMIVPMLCRSFLDVSLPLTARTALGEAAVKVCERCGATLPVYAAKLVAAFLSGSNDEDAMIRASAISNLASICGTLRFGIHVYLDEIITLLRKKLSSDPAPVARQAGVLLVAMLLRSLGKDFLDILNGDRAREVYRLLRRSEATDSDHVTRVHARIALAELDSLMRQFLFPAHK